VTPLGATGGRFDLQAAPQHLANSTTRSRRLCPHYFHQRRSWERLLQPLKQQIYDFNFESKKKIKILNFAAFGGKILNFSILMKNVSFNLSELDYATSESLKGMHHFRHRLNRSSLLQNLMDDFQSHGKSIIFETKLMFSMKF
jgi:hypothetical protein